MNIPSRLLPLTCTALASWAALALTLPAQAQTPPPASTVFPDPATAQMAESLAKGDPQAVLLGISRGVSPDARGYRGQRPIHYVSRYANELSMGSLRALIAAGADPNLADDEGRTALGWAALRNDAEAARVLLGSGADPKALSSGKLPIVLSIEAGARAPFEVLAVSGSPLMGAGFARGGAASDLLGSGKTDWVLWLGQRGLLNARSQGPLFWSSLCPDPSPPAAALRQLLATQPNGDGCRR